MERTELNREPARTGSPLDHKLLLGDGLATQMSAHAEEAYPEEACGGLLGWPNGDILEVVVIAPLMNSRESERRRRYLIGADDVRELERRAAAAGLQIVGYYHSHPDAPAAPSAHDREHAWPWYAYLIVSVRDGIAEDLSAWRLSDDRAQFNRLAITGYKPHRPQKEE